MSAKIGPRVKLLAANIIQKLMPIEDGNEHVFYELCGIIAAHAPVDPFDLPVGALFKQQQEVNGTWGVYEKLDNGTAAGMKYRLVSGGHTREEATAILNREQEKQP